MNKKQIFFILFFLVILSVLTVFLVWKYNILYKNLNSKEDTLIRNLSWETDFLDNIPYKKWENLEFNIIFPWEWKNKINLDLTKIKQSFNIEKIIVDDKETIENDIILKDGWSIKIITKTLDNWIIKKEDYQDLIKDVEEIKEEENIEEELKEKTFTGNINITFDKKNLNSNINNLIEISWEGKEFIKYINIGWVSLKPINENNKTFLTIAKDTFSSGEYFIIAQLENNELVPLNEKINFIHSNSKVNIANITPNSIKNDTDKFIVLQWNWFLKVISIQLSNNIVLKNTSFEVINDQVMSVKIPKELDIWNYYFNIMTTEGISELKNNIFTIN